MNPTPSLTYEFVMEKLPVLVADCLGIDQEDVSPELVFCSEGDSIEIMDLNFRCEKAFGIKSPFRLFLGSRDQLTLDADGCLTEKSVEFVRDNFPFFAVGFATAGKTRLSPHDLLGYFTVEMIAQFILHAAKEQAGNSQAA